MIIYKTLTSVNEGCQNDKASQGNKNYYNYSACHKRHSFLFFDNKLNYLLSNCIVEITCGLNAGNKFISVCVDLSEQPSYWIKICLADFWRLPDRAMKLWKERVMKRSNHFGRLFWDYLQIGKIIYCNWSRATSTNAKRRANVIVLFVMALRTLQFRKRSVRLTITIVVARNKYQSEQKRC